MISRRRSMVLKSFVFRQTRDSVDLAKEPGVANAIKKLKTQCQALEKSPALGLYRYSVDHISPVTRGISTKSFPALSSVSKKKYVVEWTDELGASWKDENVLLIGFDDIQSVNEWGEHRQRSHGP